MPLTATDRVDMIQLVARYNHAADAGNVGALDFKRGSDSKDSINLQKQMLDTLKKIERKDNVAVTS